MEVAVAGRGRTDLLLLMATRSSFRGFLGLLETSFSAKIHRFIIKPPENVENPLENTSDIN